MTTATLASDRLDFTLPGFCRVSWASDAARDVWEPRIQSVSAAWQEIEWLSVAAGVRPCAVTVAGTDELVDRSARVIARGMASLPVDIERAPESAYAVHNDRPRLGDPIVFRFAVGTVAHLREFKAAWDALDNAAIGELLGYPPCCRSAFEHVWEDESLTDTTWASAVAAAGDRNGARLLEVHGPPESNVLLRWLGVRAVSHLPCSFACEPSAALGRALIAVGRDEGFADEMDWLSEMLCWPAEWSALHGIAEIKTPVLRVAASTDATAHRWTVRRPGSAYPAEGARGLVFPFDQEGASLTPTHGFRRGFDAPILAAEALPDWYASDNGFTTVAAMDEAHAAVVDVARAALDGPGGNVLDLGCGNGALLRRIVAAADGVRPWGIELDPERAAHAGLLLPAFADHFAAGDLFASDWPWQDGRHYALALVMPGRLTEVPADQAERLRARLRAHCDAVLVYAYGDWLTRYGDLGGLARRAGFGLLSAGPVRAGLATVLDGSR